jgi:hypothetical protein
MAIIKSKEREVIIRLVTGGGVVAATDERPISTEEKA